MYIIQYTVYSEQCAVYSVQCTIYLTLHRFSLILCSATMDLKPSAVCNIKCAVDSVQCRQFFWWYTGQISAVDAPISINCKGRFKTTFKTTYQKVYIHNNRVIFNKSVCLHYFWLNLSGWIEAQSVKTTVFSNKMNKSVTIRFSSLNWNPNREQREIWNDSREKSWNVIWIKLGDREPFIPLYYRTARLPGLSLGHGKGNFV